MERPLILSTPDIMKIITGKKIQTRQRIVIHNGPLGFPMYRSYFDGEHTGWTLEPHFSRVEGEFPEEYYFTGSTPWQPRDIAWVQEDWYDEKKNKIRPASQMPRSLAQVCLLITEVKVHRILEISESDARKEGCISQDPVAEFLNGWKRKFGEDFLDKDPWVAALTFKPFLNIPRGNGDDR